MHIKPELKGALLTLLGVAVVAVGLWVTTGVRFGIWTCGQYERYLWVTENLGIAHELWHGHIKAGEDVEQLVRFWHPDKTNKFTRWMKLTWVPGGLRPDTIPLTGVTVIAKDGVLALASYWSDDGLANRVFFDTLTSKDEVEYQSAFQSYVNKLLAEHQKAESRAHTGEQMAVPCLQIHIALSRDAAKRLSDVGESIRGSIIFDGDGIKKGNEKTAPGRDVPLGYYKFERYGEGMVNVTNAAISKEAYGRLTNADYFYTVNVYSGRHVFTNNILDGGYAMGHIREAGKAPIMVECALLPP